MDNLISIIGYVSLAMIFMAYTLMQMRKIEPTQVSYLLLNLCGSCGLMVTLTVDWNLGGFIINSFWALISVYGLMKQFRKAA